MPSTPNQAKNNPSKRVLVRQLGQGQLGQKEWAANRRGKTKMPQRGKVGWTIAHRKATEKVGMQPATKVRAKTKAGSSQLKASPKGKIRENPKAKARQRARCGSWAKLASLVEPRMRMLRQMTQWRRPRCRPLHLRQLQVRHGRQQELTGPTVQQRRSHLLLGSRLHARHRQRLQVNDLHKLTQWEVVLQRRNIRLTKSSEGRPRRSSRPLLQQCAPTNSKVLQACCLWELGPANSSMLVLQRHRLGRCLLIRRHLALQHHRHQLGVLRHRLQLPLRLRRHPLCDLLLLLKLQLAHGLVGQRPKRQLVLASRPRRLRRQAALVSCSRKLLR